MICYGKNNFFEALKNRKITKAYVLDGNSMIETLKKNQIKFVKVEKKQLDKLVDARNHQGIVFEIPDYKTYELKDIIHQKHKLIVMLDGLEDPHNLGAILRTSDAIGVDGVIYKKNNAVGLTDTVAKVSTGAIEYVKCVEVVNLNNTIEYLKKEGYWIVGLEAKHAVSYETLDYNMNICLVIGSEGKGISRLVSEKLDFKVSLPMIGYVNSLNASNAFAIMVYKIYESRNLSTSKSGKNVEN